MPSSKKRSSCRRRRRRRRRWQSAALARRLETPSSRARVARIAPVVHRVSSRGESPLPPPPSTSYRAPFQLPPRHVPQSVHSHTHTHVYYIRRGCMSCRRFCLPPVRSPFCLSVLCAAQRQSTVRCSCDLPSLFVLSSSRSVFASPFSLALLSLLPLNPSTHASPGAIHQLAPRPPWPLNTAHTPCHVLLLHIAFAPSRSKRWRSRRAPPLSRRAAPRAATETTF